MGALLATVFVLAGCRVDAEVAITVEDDGGGEVAVTVELDADAAAQLGDAAVAPVDDDLRAAGWTIAEPETVDGGGVRFRAVRSFATPDQLPAVLDEVGGPDGVFRDVQLTIEDRFGETEYRFAAQVVLTGSPEQFSDAELAAQLDGLPLGRTPEELFLAGAMDPAAMALRVVVGLPGGLPDTGGRFADGAASWEFPVTGGEATDTRITSTSTVESSLTVLVALGVLLLIAAAVVAVVAFRRR